MSATIQEELFSRYFSCPVIYVQGRMFPVDTHYIEDVNAFVATSQKKAAKGAGTPSTAKVKRAQPQTNAQPLSHAPRFNAELIAELVIRIIDQFSVKKVSNRYERSGASNSTPDRGDGILVFLSGIQAIRKVNYALRRRKVTDRGADVLILHGMLAPEVRLPQF